MKTPTELGRNPLGPPKQFVWKNYPEAWVKGNFANTMRNSIVLVAGTVAGVLCRVAWAPTAWRSWTFPARAFHHVFVGRHQFAHSALPGAAFFLWRQLGLVTSLLGVVIIYIAINSPFAIFLLRSYMLQLPSDFEDAARVDGASEWMVFWRWWCPFHGPVF